MDAPTPSPERRQLEYPLLLVGLFCMFLLSPWRQHHFLIGALATATQLVLLWAAWRVLRTHKLLALVAAALGIASLVLSNFKTETSRLLAEADAAVVSGFLLCLLPSILLDLFRGKRVTRDTLCGAACVYLLLGLIWASVYQVVFLFDSDALRIAAGDVLEREDFFYFSFVVLTTVGFGDIVPVSQAARSLAILEALLGQLYLVVFMARLVGMNLQAETTEQGAR